MEPPQSLLNWPTTASQAQPMLDQLEQNPWHIGVRPRENIFELTKETQSLMGLEKSPSWPARANRGRTRDVVAVAWRSLSPSLPPTEPQAFIAI